MENWTMPPETQNHLKVLSQPKLESSTTSTELKMTKSDLWKEDLITIIIVLSLVFIGDIKKEWKEWKETRSRAK